MVEKHPQYDLEVSSAQHFRLSRFHVGMGSILGVAAAVIVYTAVTWKQPNREWMALTMAVAFFHIPSLWILRHRFVSSRYSPVFFSGWSVGLFVFILILCVLDGGITSPMMLLWIPPLLYLSLGYSRSGAAVCSTIALILYILTAWLGSDFQPWPVFVLQLVIFCNVVFMIVFGAHIRHRKDRDLRRLRQKLAVMATTDQLTGCLNQRAFASAALAEVERAARFGHPLSLLAIDLDDFKHINDHYGHMMGDTILQQVGAILRRTLRKTDIAGRIGGDELALIAPETEAADARILARRLQQQNTEHSMAVEATLSIGICTMIPKAGEVSTLRQRADQALYAAKHQGRGRIVVIDHAAQADTQSQHTSAR